MYCGQCGTEATTAAITCAGCGTALAPTAAPRPALGVPAASLVPPPSAPHPSPRSTSPARSVPAPRRSWGSRVSNGARIGAKFFSSALAVAAGVAAAAAGEWAGLALVAVYLIYLWVFDGSWIIY